MKRRKAEKIKMCLRFYRNRVIVSVEQIENERWQGVGL